MDHPIQALQQVISAFQTHGIQCRLALLSGRSASATALNRANGRSGRCLAWYRRHSSALLGGASGVVSQLRVAVCLGAHGADWYDALPLVSTHLKTCCAATGMKPSSINAANMNFMAYPLRHGISRGG